MHKHPKQLRTSVTAIMARGLLCLFSGISLSGCLIPQDDQVIPELPPLRNRAPKIVSWTPPEVQVQFYSSLNCTSRNPRFQVLVSDADVGDTLYSAWFLNDAKLSRDFFQSSQIKPTNAETRPVDAPTDSSFVAALANLTTGTHVLSVIVLDNQIQIPIEEGVVVPIEDGLKDQHSWTLQVSPCP